ncbi:MFS transporter [Halobacteriales archaeon Cl-PHB]
MSAEDTDGVDWRSATIYLVIAAAVVGPMDTPLISPALPGARTALGLTDAQVGLFITAMAIPGIFTAPLIGMTADRYGRTRLLGGFLVVYGLAGGLVPVAAPNFEAILALRFLQGLVGSSILTSLAMTLVGDYYDGTARNAAMGVLSGTVTFGVAVYPSIGGFLADVEWQLPFYLYLVSVGVGLAVWLGLDEPTTQRTSMGMGYLRQAVDAVPSRRALLLYGASAGSFLLLFGGVLTVVPLILDAAGLSASTIGLLISAALLVTALVSTANAPLARRLSTGGLVGLGFVSYGLGLVGAGLAPSPLFVGGALLAFGLGHGLVFPTLASAIAGLTDSRYRAGVMSIRTSMLMAGQAVGPWLFPRIGGLTGYSALLVGAGLFAVLTGLLALSLLRSRRGLTPSPV